MLQLCVSHHDHGPGWNDQRNVFKTNVRLVASENFYPGQSPKYALGIFSACYKLAVLMGLAIQAFRYAAEPFFFSNASDKQSPAAFCQSQSLLS